MPNVPNLPGVPQLSSYTAAVATLLIVDAIQVLGGLFAPKWGVFLGNVPVVIADNVVSLEYKEDWSIATYPIEQGGFTSYDKVASPFQVRIRFSSGGSLVNRQALLRSVQAMSDSLNLFDVVTPEITYIGLNLSHFDYGRTADRGVGLLTIDTWWDEIRETGESQFSTSTKEPNGASQTNGGLVQAQPATAAQVQKVSAGIQ